MHILSNETLQIFLEKEKIESIDGHVSFVRNTYYYSPPPYFPTNKSKQNKTTNKNYPIEVNTKKEHDTRKTNKNKSKTTKERKEDDN